jgi:signal peptidase I
MKFNFGLLLLVFVLLSIGLYLGNPSGTASMDPRARLLGLLPYKIPSASNSPALVVGDIVLVYTYSYWFDPVPRGDLVVFIPSHDPRAFVKRVVAVGGDRISINDGLVVLNDTIIEEPYVSPGNNTLASSMRDVTIPAGKLFVMGDNRDRSEDSRTYGLVNVSGVVGRVGPVF